MADGASFSPTRVTWPGTVGGGDQDVLAGNDAFHVAAGLRGEVDDDRTGPHALHHLPGHQERGPPAGDGRRRNQDIRLGDVRREQLPLQGAGGRH